LSLVFFADDPLYFGECLLCFRRILKANLVPGL
jgi:hypothetical protein